MYKTPVITALLVLALLCILGVVCRLSLLREVITGDFISPTATPTESGGGIPSSIATQWTHDIDALQTVSLAALASNTAVSLANMFNSYAWLGIVTVTLITITLILKGKEPKQ